MKYLSLLVLLTGILLLACKKEENQFVPVCDGSAPTYDADIAAIINQNCVGCHSQYATYSGLSNVLNSGAFEREVLIDQTMPQNASLSEAQLNTIKCWVDNGYPEN
jgi:hypothetical protein